MSVAGAVRGTMPGIGSYILFSVAGTTYALPSDDDPIGTLPRLPRQYHRIENQHDIAVAEIGGARDPVHLYEIVGDGAHHDLALADNAVHRDAQRRCAGADDKQVQTIARGVRQAEKAGQADHRERRAAMRRHLVPLHLQQRGNRHLDHFAHGALRDGERLGADPGDERVGNRKGDRQLEYETGTGPLLGL